MQANTPWNAGEDRMNHRIQRSFIMNWDEFNMETKL